MNSIYNMNHFYIDGTNKRVEEAKRQAAWETYRLLMDDKYVNVQFRKETHPEFMEKLRRLLYGEAKK